MVTFCARIVRMKEKPLKLFDDSPLSPGEHLRGLLQEKGWTQDELAAITGHSRQQINRIISGEHGITAEMAIALGAALGMSPRYWLELDNLNRLAQANNNAEAVSQRARIYELAPIKDMQRRGWIAQTKQLNEMERELCKFFGVESLAEPPGFPVATRKTASLGDLTPPQRAWCFRARELATCITLPRRTKSPQTDGFIRALRRLAAYPKEVRRLPETMADYGVRLVVVEPLPGAKIDGATFWLNDDSPVIAVSVRYDRIDAFWYTVMHEVAHVQNKDALSVDTDLSGDYMASTLLKDDTEQRADREAAAALVPPNKLDSFIRRVGPLYSKPRIIQFAHTIKMHPGIIVGQLQHLGELGYSAHREMLVKIRDHISAVALTDGWGRTISPNVI